MKKIIEKIMLWLGYMPAYQMASYIEQNKRFEQQKYLLSEFKVERIIYPAEYYDQIIRDIIELKMKDELCHSLSDNIRILDGFECGNRVLTATIIIAIKK